MITRDLYQAVLLDPMSSGCDNLRIVSGFASAAMAFDHFQRASSFRDFRAELCVGMTPAVGISQANHTAFRNLCESDLNNRLTCMYAFGKLPVHSKVYVWCSSGKPQIAFAGSANYTQTGFSDLQHEVMEETDPFQANEYFESVESRCIACTQFDIEHAVQIVADRDYYRRLGKLDLPSVGSVATYAGLPHAKLSLLERSGEIHDHSGLNWSFRKRYVRHDPNQAYIPIPSKIAKSDFFPQRPTQFSVTTDDRKTFVCVRAQDGGKAIHTPQNNALLGVYFRERIGVPLSGVRVTKEDLLRYGRTDVDFYKVEEETFVMDFSV